ncbi:MAG: hypothetical protein LAN70_02140 [Acidobacteriia bacterium]|nr:hypothetical protein [Terriglobia bacterium]
MAKFVEIEQEQAEWLSGETILRRALKDDEAQEVRQVTRFGETRGNVIDVRCEATQELARERGITFGEALRQADREDATRAALSRAVRNGNVDLQSVIFAEAAQQRASEKGIDYGTALREVYAEGAPFTRADGAMRQILVAAIQDGQVILNAGTAAGLKVGDRLSVQRLDREITDPAQKQVIRKIYLPLGTITITKLDDVSADAKGANVGQLKVGDVCTVLTAG